MNSPLDSRQLRAFITLARTGSFTQAARELHISQSAVSHSMKALEAEVGCRLLDRQAKRVLLTQAGEQLLHHAQKILQEMDVARASLLQLGKWGRSRLRIGASTTACQSLLPPVLREFKESFPHCMINIEPGDTLQTLDVLRDERIDLAITLQTDEDPRLEFHPLFEDEMVFLMSPLHPWATEGSVTREEIPKQNYVFYSKASHTFRLIEDYFRREKMVLNAVIELGSMEAIKELVKLGLGLSILAPWIARKELAERSLVALPLGKRKLKRQWCVVHRRRHRLSFAEETFVGLCRTVSTTLTSSAPPALVHEARGDD